jgi:hypothetical protein
MHTVEELLVAFEHDPRVCVPEHLPRLLKTRLNIFRLLGAA